MKIIKNSEPMLTLYVTSEEDEELVKLLKSAKFQYLGYYEGDEYWINDKTYIIVRDEEED